MFSLVSVYLFVCLFTQPIFTKFSGKVTEETVRFGGNPDHVTLGLWLGAGCDYG